MLQLWRRPPSLLVSLAKCLFCIIIVVCDYVWHIKFLWWVLLKTLVLIIICPQLKWSLSPLPTTHPACSLTTQEKGPTSSLSQAIGRLLIQLPWRQEVTTGGCSVLLLTSREGDYSIYLSFFFQTYHKTLEVYSCLLPYIFKAKTSTADYYRHSDLEVVTE